MYYFRQNPMPTKTLIMIREDLEPDFSTDEQQLELKNQQPNEGTGTSHAPLEGHVQSYRINFSELQRLRLRQLQHKLVKYTVDLRCNAVEPKGWAEDRREYGKLDLNCSSYILLSFYQCYYMLVQARQNYDYMGKHIAQAQDLFMVSGERIIDRRMLETAMRNQEDEADPLYWANSVVEWETLDIHPNPVGGTRDENFRQAWNRAFDNDLA